MNERIKELSKEAGLVADATYAKAPDATWLREYNKKFAELIVLECLLCCERTISDPVPESVDTFEQGGIHCREEIKQHFGVEE